MVPKLKHIGIDQAGTMIETPDTQLKLTAGTVMVTRPTVEHYETRGDLEPLWVYIGESSEQMWMSGSHIGEKDWGYEFSWCHTSDSSKIKMFFFDNNNNKEI